VSVPKKVIQHIAGLAKLDINEQTSQSFSVQVGSVLEYVDILRELNTENVPPTNQVTGIKNVCREDIIREYPLEKREKLFREAPQVKDGYIVVPHSIS
jgi:aspartyl-tRNA(Asn)/glutamyl-tRNA(Gln) amidotransferase subunit C